MNNPGFNDTISVFDNDYVDLDEPKNSFDQPRLVNSVPTSKPKRRFIISQTIVDKFTIPRKRELLVPSRCIICQFDIAKKNNTTWEDVPEHVRPRMLEALEKHVEMAHNQSENLIIDEDQMPTRWLGPERGLKDI